MGAVAFWQSQMKRWKIVEQENAQLRAELAEATATIDRQADHIKQMENEVIELYAQLKAAKMAPTPPEQSAESHWLMQRLKDLFGKG
jgi:hypothetical protein